MCAWWVAVLGLSNRAKALLDKPAVAPSWHDGVGGSRPLVGELRVDRAYLVLAAKYVRRQAKQLAEQLEGIRLAEDIEFVHRARVATRRLRAALRMFDKCLGRKLVCRWQREIRLVTNELGAARDKDVQIAFLCETLHGLDDAACCPGVARLLVKLECSREALQPGVLKAIKRLKASTVLDEMQRITKKALAKLNADEVALGSKFARRKTAKHVRAQLNELLSYQDCLADPADQQRHHAMRIAAKRLRYTLEISSPVYEKRLDPAIEAVKRLQMLLGDIHDCDVWADDLARFAQRQRRQIARQFGNEGPWARLERGVRHLREDRQARRQALFGELVAYWTELSVQQPWDRLAAILEGRASGVAAPDGEPPSPPGPPPATPPEPPAPAAREKSNGSQKTDGLPPRSRPEPAEEVVRRPVRLPHAIAR